MTRRIDKLAAFAFRFGGSVILLMVFAILVFIVLQVIPLFQDASVSEDGSADAVIDQAVILGVDEWAEYPFLMDSSGDFHFFRLGASSVEETLRPEGIGGAKPQAWAYEQENNHIALALDNGTALIINVAYKPEFDQEMQRTVSVSLETEEPFTLDGRGAVTALSFFQTDRKRLMAWVEYSGQRSRLRVMSLTRKVGLLSAGSWAQSETLDLTEALSSIPEHVLVGGHADLMLVATKSGSIEVFQAKGNQMQHVQKFQPFEDKKIQSMHWLAGRRSVVICSDSGDLRIFSPAPDAESGGLAYGLAEQLSPFPEPVSFFSHSLRNRSFLVGSGDRASLFYGTTGAVLWEEKLPFEPKLALIGSRYQSLLFYSADGYLHRFELDDPHPEASLIGFFGKIRYEGQSEARYVWQSTGGGDAFEPKLSLVPLLIGTFKGTFYAMLFAIPLAISAALYSAHFLNGNTRRLVKPTMEIMASLPSVVIGFLAALWLAPLIDERVPSVLLGLLFIPLSAILVATIWARMPNSIREYIPEGREFIPLLPITALAFWVGWQLGPVLEHLLFVVHDPVSGQAHADFRLWWQETLGLHFEQRNALVIGFMMGFAVIPIIFTLSEDAMANVPQSLLSGSLALGASRWETARRIVFPMALPGIFSALMIGFGRAVGETMIVVMATGNTPVTDMNLFSGMRTLAANIAVELPEAPYGGTLYRTLFLGAMLLFVLTFIVNTFAELMRERIRKRYKSIV